MCEFSKLVFESFKGGNLEPGYWPVPIELVSRWYIPIPISRWQTQLTCFSKHFFPQLASANSPQPSVLPAGAHHYNVVAQFTPQLDHFLSGYCQRGAVLLKMRQFSPALPEFMAN